jgi:hypothetical protein
MNHLNDADQEQSSGLFLGSEPLGEVRHRSAAKKDDSDAGKDGLLGDKGDDDAVDGDKADSDTTDKVDGDEGAADADGKD